MGFVEVLVGELSYHGNEPLTYVSEEPLARGRVVRVPLRRKLVLGLVASTGHKPVFPVKPLAEVPALPQVPPQLIDLLQWMRAYYPAPLGITTQLFLPKDLPKQPLAVATIPSIESLPLPPLTLDQQHALKAISGSGSHLLHGETGTGKTRVYIELAQSQLAQGKSAIVLTPEIGLTSQLANDFRAVFGERVVVMHSGLTEAQRARNWQYILEQIEPLIVIGARSALFAPLRHIGLVVVDESHETAYKQDQAPYYHATSVAAKLATLHGATLVLGSATPLVSDYYIASAKQRPIVRMTKTAASASRTKRHVAIVDLRKREEFTKSPHLSNTLLSSIQDTLEKQEQVLLFLNRRGTARIILCERCGWQALCPHCDLPLVYHGDQHVIRCHSCDYKAPSPTSCPACHNPSVVFKSIGTKAVAEEASRLFPEARVMRFDTDNKKSERIEQHYDSVRAGGIDILVGTQTLAKGLDLPKLGLVGVIIADTSLYFPDFSAQERTYQLLSQVLGRIGRGHRDSRAVLQTYNPESPLFKAVITKDWDTFYNNELIERRMFVFSPFCHLLKLSCERATSAAAQHAAQNLIKKLQEAGIAGRIEGPTPSFHEKIQSRFVWQLIVKAKRRAELLRVISMLPSGWSYDIDPMNLL